MYFKIERFCLKTIQVDGIAYCFNVKIVSKEKSYVSRMFYCSSDLTVLSTKIYDKFFLKIQVCGSVFS